jgi:putative ABC transport system permease protein
MKHNPPGFAKRILRWFCHAEFIEEVEGDLNELFEQRIQQRGLFNARIHYFLDVLHSTNIYRTKPRKKVYPQSLPLRDQLNHFFKIAFRNMLRSRSSSFINLSGLAISLASFLFIALYILDETTYDAYHPNADEVYRISYSFRGFDESEGKDSRAAGLWSVTLKESMPEIKQFTRFSRFGYPGNVWSGNKDHVFVEQQFFWVDSTLTDIFSIPLVTSGNVRKILADPQYVIINENMARKYFGKEDAVGQSITYVRDGMDFILTVGAVMKNAPSNTHFKPDFIANQLVLIPLWKQNGGDRINSWGDSFSYSFIRIEPGTDLDKVKQTLQDLFTKNIGEHAATTHPILIPLRDLHFTSGLLFELEAPGETSHLYIFGSIGLLILVMACINYMNLATARSIRRSKEVGLRKTLGVHKISLMAQFLGESFLMTGIALILAVIIIAIMLPSFNALTSKNFSLFALLPNNSMYLLLCVVVVVGLVAGSYPAFYLSGFKPIAVLKGTFVAGRGAEQFRQVLVVVQISITLLLLTGTFVIHNQLKFIDHAKLSEYKDQIVTVRLGDIAREKLANFKQHARQDPQVMDISTGPHLPRRENFGNMTRQFHVPELGDADYSWDQLDGDFDFTTMFQLEVIAGRNFSKSNPADSNAILINESAVRELGITNEKAVGLTTDEITFYERNGEMMAVQTIRPVIGVVKDFSYASIRKVIEPIAISGKENTAEMMYIKLEGETFPAAIDRLQHMWNQIYPATPFQYWFMDEEFGRLYQTERQMAKLFVALASIAIIIACLGLFGLASFTAEQKMKEIGIRKVLGASAFQVLLLLTSRYVKLTMLAFVLGVPITYLVIRSWMGTFAYKAEVGNWFYLWACLLIIFFTLITVGIESVRAARANPSDSIRHE